MSTNLYFVFVHIQCYLLLILVVHSEYLTVAGSYLCKSLKQYIDVKCIMKEVIEYLCTYSPSSSSLSKTILLFIDCDSVNSVNKLPKECR